MKEIFTLFLCFLFNISIAQITDFKNIDFTRADNIAKLNQGAKLNNLPLLGYQLTSKLPTKVEQFRAIYTWVCLNIKGDSRQQNKITSARKKMKNDSLALVNWNTKYKKKAFKKLLKSNKTMCTGYAYLIKELAFLADIECRIIDGYGRTVYSNIDSLQNANHSWNAVKLNNKWYLCDATWSSGYLDENFNFITSYNDGYFLADPVMFAANHFPIQQKWLLNEVTTKSTFTESPLVYGEVFKYKIASLYPSKMNMEVQKDKETKFSFRSFKNVPLNEISLIVYLGSKEYAFKIYNIQTKNGIISFKNKFHWKGFYDVHLKIKDDVVATYSINVI